MAHPHPRRENGQPVTAPRTPEAFDWYQHPSPYPHLNPVRQMLTAAGWEEQEALRASDGDGSHDEVLALMIDHDYRTDLAIAHTMGLVGDWGTDDIHDAVTNALHEYRDFRAQRIALLALQADLLDGHREGLVSRESVRRVHEILTTTDPYVDHDDVAPVVTS
jgi:hypothetical protein